AGHLEPARRLPGDPAAGDGLRHRLGRPGREDAPARADLLADAGHPGRRGRLHRRLRHRRAHLLCVRQHGR
ncbi:MAG: NADH-ubiquinone oxidoreductase chain N, partial [uncultured Ramlibacter sp.]